MNAEAREDPESAAAGGTDGWQELLRAANGDERAFESLVRRYQRRLHALCWRLLLDVGDAEEVVQEVFLELYRRASSFRPEGRLYTLLYRIATNRCLNRLRRRRVVRFFSLDGAASDQDHPLDPPATASGPEERMQAVERWRRTRQAIVALPPGQRAVLALIKLEGLSYRETAEVLGISLGAVESRLFRAMRRLERQLGNGA